MIQNIPWLVRGLVGKLLDSTFGSGSILNFGKPLCDEKVLPAFILIFEFVLCRWPEQYFPLLRG